MGGHSHLCGSQQSLVDEMHKGEVLQEVVLYGCAAEQHPSLRLQAHQRLVRLVLGIFQAVSLVAQHEAHFVLVQDVRVQAERFVTYYENGRHASAVVGFHEADELGVNLRFLSTVDGESVDFVVQPFVNFVVPILHERARRDDDCLLYEGLSFRSCKRDSRLSSFILRCMYLSCGNANYIILMTLTLLQ